MNFTKTRDYALLTAKEKKVFEGVNGLRLMCDVGIKIHKKLWQNQSY